MHGCYVSWGNGPGALAFVLRWLSSGQRNGNGTGGCVGGHDIKTLKEVERLPKSKPIGKYNVWNKIKSEAGTSH